MAQTPKTATQLSDISMGELVSTLTEETKTINETGTYTFFLGDSKHIKVVNKVKNLLLIIKNKSGAGKISLVDDVKDKDNVNVVHQITIERHHKNAPPRKLRATKAGTYDITLKHPGQLSSVEIGVKPRITLKYDAKDPMTPQDRMIFLMASLHDNVTIPQAKAWDDRTFDKFMNFVLKKGGIKVQNKDVDIDLDFMVSCFAHTGKDFPEIPSNFANGIVKELNSLRKKGYRICPMKGTSKEAKALFKKMNLVKQEQKKIVSQQKKEVSVSTTPQNVSVVTTKAPPQQSNAFVQTYINSVEKALKKKKGSERFIQEIIQGLLDGGVKLKRDKQNKPELVLYPEQILKQRYDQETIEKLAEILYNACPNGCFVRVTERQPRSSLTKALKNDNNPKIMVARVLAGYGR